jgi:hypothetical protein
VTTNVWSLFFHEPNHRDEGQDGRAGGEPLHLFLQADGVVEVLDNQGQPDPEQQPEDEPEKRVA